MAENIPSSEELFQQAEHLWSLIQVRANHLLGTIVADCSHDIVIDIADNKRVQWPDDLKYLATALKSQGDVMGALDELRILDKKIRK